MTLSAVIIFKLCLYHGTCHIAGVPEQESQPNLQNFWAIIGGSSRAFMDLLHSVYCRILRFKISLISTE